MGTNRTVSIVIPVFNRLTFIDQAIASALAQSQAPLEILAVDDGSTADVAGHLAKWQESVRYIRRDNGGQGAARNTALAQCRGEYVLFLDDDDCLNAGAVEKLLAAIEISGGAVWAAGGYDYVDVDGKTLGRSHLPGIQKGDLLAQMIRGNPVGAPLAVLLNVEAVREAGGFDEDRRLQTAEDHDLWISLARRHPPACTREIVARYRKHPQNATGNLTGHLAARLAMLAKQRGLSTSAYAPHFDAAEAILHREYGDVCYLAGRQGEARSHWRLAADGGGLNFGDRMLRVAKSYLPTGARGMMRRGTQAVRSGGEAKLAVL